MKKVLLSLAAVALSASFASADVFTYTATGLTDNKVDYTATPGTAPAIEFKTAKNNGTTNPTFIKNGSDIRLYALGSLTLSVPEDYTIEKVVINISTQGLKRLAPITSSVGTIATQVNGDKTVTWTGEASSSELAFTVGAQSDFGSETNKAGQLCFTSIQVTANKIDLGGKLPAGIFFPKSEYTLAKSNFVANPIQNPNNLTLTYTSSDPEILTIDEWGFFSCKGYGKVTVTATSEETAEFAAGSASAEFNFVESANSIAQMIEKAPEIDNTILVDTRLTVSFAGINGTASNVFVTDIYGNSTLLYGFNLPYKTGDVLNSGWVATNATYNGLLEWKGNPEVYGNEVEYLTYPQVEVVSQDDVNRVVMLNGVTFADATTAERSSFTGTLADGTSVNFYNGFKVATVAAGTYDVLCAVTIATGGDLKGQLQVLPIEYVAPFVAPEFPTGIKVVSDGNEATSELTYSEGMGYTLNINLTATSDQCAFTIDLPMGWDEIYTYWYEDVEYGDINAQPTVLKAAPAEWVDPSMLGMTAGNTFTVKTSAAGAEYEGIMMLGCNGKADAANQISVVVKATKGNTLAVETIETADADAEYFTLQGVKVANPENGIYVKVANGKATKVVVK